MPAARNARRETIEEAPSWRAGLPSGPAAGPSGNVGSGGDVGSGRPRGPSSSRHPPRQALAPAPLPRRGTGQGVVRPRSSRLPRRRSRRRLARRTGTRPRRRPRRRRSVDPETAVSLVRHRRRILGPGRPDPGPGRLRPRRRPEPDGARVGRGGARRPPRDLDRAGGRDGRLDRVSFLGDLGGDAGAGLVDGGHHRAPERALGVDRQTAQVRLLSTVGGGRAPPAGPARRRAAPAGRARPCRRDGAVSSAGPLPWSCLPADRSLRNEISISLYVFSALS